MEEIYLTIEGEPGAEIQVRQSSGDDNSESDASRIVLTGRLGSDGRITVKVPRTYLVIGYTERDYRLAERLDQPDGDSVTVSLDYDRQARIELDEKAEEDETVKESPDHDFVAQSEEADREAVRLDAAKTAARPWRAANSLLKLREQINRRAPRRSKASDGTIGDERHCGSSASTSDHCPRIIDNGVGVVTAMDITHDPSNGCDANQIAEAIRTARDARVKYIIWNRRIANSSAIGGAAPWAWRPYTGSNPHTRHIHISVKSASAQYDSTSEWQL